MAVSKVNVNPVLNVNAMQIAEHTLQVANQQLFIWKLTSVFVTTARPVAPSHLVDVQRVATLHQRQHQRHSDGYSAAGYFAGVHASAWGGRHLPQSCHHSSVYWW